jgi:hypothetical protein
MKFFSIAVDWDNEECQNERQRTSNKNARSVEPIFFFSAKKKKRERNPQKLSSSHERQAASAVLVCGYLRSQHKARAAQPAVPNPEQTS